MKYSTHDIWSYPQEVLKIVTTNGYVRRNSELVMGRGAAKQAKDKFPVLPLDAGLMLETLYPTTTLTHKYGFIYVQPHDIGLFQVKYHWEDPADLDLIAFSVKELTRFATLFPRQMVMNYPGIGNGRLTKDQVAPLLESLPGNITVCEVK